MRRRVPHDEIERGQDGAGECQERDAKDHGFSHIPLTREPAYGCKSHVVERARQQLCFNHRDSNGGCAYDSAGGRHIPPRRRVRTQRHQGTIPFNTTHPCHRLFLGMSPLIVDCSGNPARNNVQIKSDGTAVNSCGNLAMFAAIRRVSCLSLCGLGRVPPERQEARYRFHKSGET